MEQGIEIGRQARSLFSNGIYVPAAAPADAAAKTKKLLDNGDSASTDFVARTSSRPDFAVLMYAVSSMHDDIAHMGSRNSLLGRIVEFFTAEITPFITRDGYANAAVDKLLAAIGNWANIGTKLRWPYRSIPGRSFAPP